MFLQGEYGIGKSSLANFAQVEADANHCLHPVYVSLGAVASVDEVAAKFVEGVLNSKAIDPTKGEIVRNFLAKYVGEQSPGQLFTIHADKLQADGPQYRGAMLEFLKEVLGRLAPKGVKGLFIVVDEINGIASDPAFSGWVKNLIDTNAVAQPPLPLLLMLCGTAERRADMIRVYPPVDRLFKPVLIDVMNDDEMSEFFQKAFKEAGIVVEAEALKIINYYSGGFPKIMHLVGETLFFLDKDGIITAEEARQGVERAAEEVGTKYVDAQVYAAVKSKDYHSILGKLAALTDQPEFDKTELAKTLNAQELRKLDNFLQKLKELHVLRPGASRGLWVFQLRLVHLYIRLDHLKAGGSSDAAPV
jgi:hypothetical protein